MKFFKRLLPIAFVIDVQLLNFLYICKLHTFNVVSHPCFDPCSMTFLYPCSMIFFNLSSVTFWLFSLMFLFRWLVGLQCAVYVCNAKADLDSRKLDESIHRIRLRAQQRMRQRPDQLRRSHTSSPSSSFRSYWTLTKPGGRQILPQRNLTIISMEISHSVFFRLTMYQIAPALMRLQLQQLFTVSWSCTCIVMQCLHFYQRTSHTYIYTYLHKNAACHSICKNNPLLRSDKTFPWQAAVFGVLTTYGHHILH